MCPLPLHGLFAAVLVALAIATSFLNFHLASESMTWSSLVFVALGLRFAPHTRRLFDVPYVPFPVALSTIGPDRT